MFFSCSVVKSVFIRNLLLVALTLYLNVVYTKSVNKILKRLKKDDYLDDLIQNSSCTELEVHYRGYVVDFGNEIQRTEINRPPVVQWSAPAGAMYTLVCVGPDVPTKSRHKNRSWLHWHIGNIPGNNTENGHTRVEYVGIVEPDYSPGLHRIVFLLYRQKNDSLLYYLNNIMRKKDDLSERLFFSPKLMSKEHDLGDPVALNYMTVTV